MRAVILGCSHAAGAEMFKDPEITTTDPFNIGWQVSYPVLVAEQLGYSPENYAISGGSNDAMFRIFNEQVAGIGPDDVVIACWTGTSRTEIWHELAGYWLPVAPGGWPFNPLVASRLALSGQPAGGLIPLADDYEAYRNQWIKYHSNPVADQLNKLKNVLALNSLAGSRSIPVINLNSFHPIPGTDSVTWAIDVPFSDWAQQQGYPHTSSGHYFLAAHKAYANLVVEAIQSASNC